MCTLNTGYIYNYACVCVYLGRHACLNLFFGFCGSSLHIVSTSTVKSCLTHSFISYNVC